MFLNLNLDLNPFTIRQIILPIGQVPNHLKANQHYKMLVRFLD